MKKLALLSTGLVFTFVACRGGGGDDTPGDDTPNPDGPPPGGLKVKDVQNEAMAKGTAVELKGVVVTAIDNYGNRTGDFFVQDAEGGPFSGIKVFGAPLDQVAALQPGDVIDITNGEKDEFALTSDMSGRTVTEIKGAAGGSLVVTKKGTGTVPAPADVDAKAIGALAKAEREAEWEKWEGVLIKVTGARQIGATRTFGSNPGPDSNEFRITGIARVQSVLAELNTDAAFGVCYASITGIGDYFFNDLILPRTQADLVTGGTGCNPFATTVVMAQTTPGAELVQLTNVVITARDDIGTTTKGFWVADAAQGAQNNGVLVFLGSTALPANYTVGAVVNVQGGLTEFDLGSPPVGNTLTEVQDVPTPLPAPTGTAVPLPLAATAADVSNITTGEPWEGVLVELSNLKVTNINAGQGKVELTDNSGAKVIMDDDSFDWPDQTANTCYAKLIGVMSIQVNDDVRTINPRSAADFIAGATCN